MEEHSEIIVNMLNFENEVVRPQAQPYATQPESPRSPRGVACKR